MFDLIVLTVVYNCNNYVRYNKIGFDGAQALATALTGNSTITELEFSCVMKDISFFSLKKNV